jgi:hypothetical protein
MPAWLVSSVSSGLIVAQVLAALPGALTVIPARMGARQPVTEVLQAEAA